MVKVCSLIMLIPFTKMGKSLKWFITVCGPSEFTCISDGSCIDRIRVCDRIPNCPDRSDEKGCPCDLTSGTLIEYLKLWSVLSCSRQNLHTNPSLSLSHPILFLCFEYQLWIRKGGGITLYTKKFSISKSSQRSNWNSKLEYHI